MLLKFMYRQVFFKLYLLAKNGFFFNFSNRYSDPKCKIAIFITIFHSQLDSLNIFSVIFLVTVTLTPKASVSIQVLHAQVFGQIVSFQTYMIREKKKLEHIQVEHFL